MIQNDMHKRFSQVAAESLLTDQGLRDTKVSIIDNFFNRSTPIMKETRKPIQITPERLELLLANSRSHFRQQEEYRELVRHINETLDKKIEKATSPDMQMLWESLKIK